jgi:hypothetical protein
MSDYVEFKAKLLNKLEQAWDNFSHSIPYNQLRGSAATRIEQLLEIWRDSKKVEARLE